MTFLILDANAGASEKLFDDEESKQLLGHTDRFGVLFGSPAGRMPAGLDAVGVVCELVADARFPLEARRKAIGWLRRHGVTITIAPQ